MIPIRITGDLSIEILQARREWQEILFHPFKKEKNLQPRLLYPARISFKYEGEIKVLQTSKSSENLAPPNPKQQSKWQRYPTYQ